MNKEEIIGKLKENKERIKRFRVKKIVIFVSFVRDEERKTSDIDLIIDSEEEKKLFNNFLNITLFLENSFCREINLLTSESICHYIKSYIEKEIIYEGILTPSHSYF